MIDEKISGIIIKCFYEVYNTLGYGFLEKVYENAMLIELKNHNLNAEKQKPIKVYYNDDIVGEYYADIIVENKIILELKTVSQIIDPHKYQLLNYLKATNIEVGLILNFGKEPEISRKIFSNDLK